MTRSGNRKSGFTLIELLVVIAIIALLISLLVPSLARAKELAKKVYCASNMRAVGLAVTQYTNEYNDWLPKLQTTIDPAANKYGYSHYCLELAPFLGLEKDDDWLEWDCGDYYFPEPGAPGILTCPSHSQDLGGPMLSYGWNWGSLGAYYDGGWSQRRRTAEVARPGETSCIGETRITCIIAGQEATSCLKYWGSYAHQNPGYENYLIARRHDDGANYLCVNGNVDYGNYYDLVDDYRDTQRVFSRGD